MSVKPGSPVHELIALYDENKLAGYVKTELGWRSSPVRWVVKIDAHGSIRKVESVEEDMVVPVLLTARSSGPAPSPANDTVKYLRDPKCWELWRSKHIHFQGEMGLPAEFADMLEGPPPLRDGTEAWREMVEAAEARKEKPDKSRFVVELPDGRRLHEMQGVVDFWKTSKILEWQNHGQPKSKWVVETEGYSSVSGAWVKLAPFHAAIGACVPGAHSGAKIGSVNSNNAGCYESYGRKGALCIPMTIEETFKLADAIRDLADYDAYGKSCMRMVSGSGQKFVAWQKKMKASKTLFLAWGPESAVSFFDLDDASSRNKAVETMEWLAGKRASEAPKIEPGDKVHFMALSAKAGGRIAVQDYWYEEAPEFVKRMRGWYDCTMMERDGLPSYVGMWKSVEALRLPKAKKEPSEAKCYAYRKLQSSVLHGRKVPDSIRSRAMEAIPGFLVEMRDKKAYLDGLNSPFRLLRACRMQDGISRGSSPYEKGRFEMSVKSASYRLGELLVKMDDAKYDYDKKKFGKKGANQAGGGMGISPTAGRILRQCLSNPRMGLAAIREKLSVFSGWALAETNDGGFDELPRCIMGKSKEDFWSGYAAALEARSIRMKKSREDEAAKALKETNAAAGTAAV